MRKLLEALRRSDEEEKVLSIAADGWNEGMKALVVCAKSLDRAAKNKKPAVKLAQKHDIVASDVEDDLTELEELADKFREASKTHDASELRQVFK